MEYNILNGDFVHKCMEAIGFGKFHVVMLISLGFRCFARGSSNCMLSILQPYLRCHMNLSIFAASWIGIVVSIGRLLGAILIGRMADQFGRRRSMLCLFSLHTVLSLLNALSSSYAMILITRASTGLVFEAVMLIYTYGMELLPMKKRNHLAIIDGFYGMGVLFAIVSAMIMLETVNWRWYVVVNETMPMAMCTLLVAILPESPRYLFSQCHIQKAVYGLKKIAAINGVDFRRAVSESNISFEDVSSVFMHPNENYPEADSFERAKVDLFVTDAAPCSKPENEPQSSTLEKCAPHQGEGSRTSLRGKKESSDGTPQLQSDERLDNESKRSVGAGAKENTASKTDLPKSELYKRIIVLACLRFAVQSCHGVFTYGPMQFKHLSFKFACGSCSASMNYKFVVTYVFAVETAFLLSFFLNGKYNRRFALLVVFIFCALPVIPFYFEIREWVKVPFYYIAGVFHFSSFIIVNIYASEVIPTSDRALATGIENTAGNVALITGDFFALYLIHTNYYAVLAALQGITIVIIIIISIFVIDAKNVPLSDS